MIIELKSKNMVYEELLECSDIFIFNGEILKFKDFSILDDITTSSIGENFKKDYLISVVVTNGFYFIKTNIDNKSKVMDAITNISNYDFNIYTHLHLHIDDSIIYI